MDSGIKKIDDQKNLFFSRFEQIRKKFRNSNSISLREEAMVLKKDIQTFRAGLGASRGTEFLESRFKWKDRFKEITRELDNIINNKET